MANEDKKQPLPKAPIGEGVDPLTDGNRYHGEDVKGNSVHDQDTAQVKKSAAKSQKTLKDQKVADEKGKTAAKKVARK